MVGFLDLAVSAPRFLQWHKKIRKPQEPPGVCHKERYPNLLRDCHNAYPKGVRVTDAEMELVNIERNGFHGEWNYTIKPRSL